MRRRALVLAALWAGCYNPKINSTDFKCGPNGLCPSGFNCQASVCVANGVQLDLSVPAFAGKCLLDGGDLSGMSGTLLADTETGAMTLMSGDGGAGMPIVAANDPGFEHLAQGDGGATSGPSVGLWSFKKLLIPSGVTIQPSTASKSVFALAACDSLELDGKIDWRGYGGFGGLAGKAGFDRNSGVVAGGGGGAADGSGGGGAGHHVDGNKGMGASGGAAGLHYGTPDVDPVHVGSGGGGGGFTTGQGMGGNGGNGGGAVALLGASVTVSGVIDVSGAQGLRADPLATMAAGGGGGGSGGSILISGDRVTFTSGENLLALGGKGGAGAASGQSGGDGSDGRIAISFTTISAAGLASTPMAQQQPGAPLTKFPR